MCRGDTEASAGDRVDALTQTFAEAPSRPIVRPAAAEVVHAPWDLDYPSAVAQVVMAIADGEIFQANIARGWEGRLSQSVTPFDLFSALHELSPAPFAGYLRLPTAALVSRSPERFLAVSPEGVARTSASAEHLRDASSTLAQQATELQLQVESFLGEMRAA